MDHVRDHAVGRDDRPPAVAFVDDDPVPRNLGLAVLGRIRGVREDSFEGGVLPDDPYVIRNGRRAGVVPTDSPEDVAGRRRRVENDVLVAVLVDPFLALDDEAVRSKGVGELGFGLT